MFSGGKQYFVYILASKRNGTLYTGVTNSLLRRVHDHKSKRNLGFTSKYNINLLVYYEVIDGAAAAIRREKQIKEWKRKWKLELIEKTNPTWRDLYEDIIKGYQ